MALATAREIGASVILVSEPNRIAMTGNVDWLKDEAIDSGIIILDSRIKIKKRGSGDGYTYVQTEMHTIFSCYSSGNRDIECFENMLDEIAGHIRNSAGKCIIAGDFNSKSPLWGMARSDNRGSIMEDWIAQNNLVVMNEGNKPTFQSENYTSILDVTLTTADIKDDVQSWDVLEEDSLSDHNYISFEIKKPDKLPQAQAKCKGWQMNKFDEMKFNQETAKLSWNEEITAGNFSRKLSELCNQTLPKRRPHPKGKPVYWWSQDIADIRRECIGKRRKHTRVSNTGNIVIITRAWMEYQTVRKKLRNSIKQAKRSAWKKLCQEIDKDIWGQGYTIAMKFINGLPAVQRLTIGEMEKATKELFLTSVINENDCDNPVIQNNDAVIQGCDNVNENEDVIFTDFTEEELEEAYKRLKNKKAPGPGCIPAEILKLVTLQKIGFVKDIYNNLARKGEFPSIWKIARLVLIPKGNKPIGEPGSLRPLSLLDVEGKLYELLILRRLENEIERTGGLSRNQYGFIKGKQTTDAVQRVVKIAEQAHSYSWKHRRVCALITLDVRNAFNCASWQQICQVLRRRDIDHGLFKIIRSYLSERRVIVESDDEERTLKITGGVPQGSILGPTLWNIMYDDLFDIDLPQEVTPIGFADDVALVITAKTEGLLMQRANTALQRVSDWMRSRHLELAPEKSESALLTRKRKMADIRFELNGTFITPKPAIKYLGVWLDTKLSFASHVTKLEEKVNKTITAMSRIMPNIGGPKATTRKILASVAHSQILYAAPVWYPACNNKKLTNRLLSLQRKLNIRCCSAYRTISVAAAGVIAGNPPIDLMALERKEKYEGIDRTQARQNLIDRWQERWDQEERASWTKKLIPNVGRWLNRPHGEVDYWLTQALSGHGTFNQYLFRFGKRESPECRYCSNEDTAEHTLFDCVRWDEARNLYRLETGQNFRLENMKECLISKHTKWDRMYQTVRLIIETKERDERLTQ